MDSSCKNCKYFVQHYAKHGSRVTTVSCGHCNNPSLTVSQRKKRFGDCCEHWTPNESEKEQRQSLENILYQIAEQLSVIAALLEKND